MEAKDFLGTSRSPYIGESYHLEKMKRARNRLEGCACQPRIHLTKMLKSWSMIAKYNHLDFLSIYRRIIPIKDGRGRTYSLEYLDFELNYWSSGFPTTSEFEARASRLLRLIQTLAQSYGLTLEDLMQ